MRRDPAPPPNRATKFWRWVFLCAYTTHLTLALIIGIESHYQRGPDFDDHRLRCYFLLPAYLLPTLFLFVASPLFVDRLGRLPVVAWFTLIAEIAWKFAMEFARHWY